MNGMGDRADVLGESSSLPPRDEIAALRSIVEGTAQHTGAEFFRSLGASPALRKTQDGAPYVTDNGNYIYDCKFAGIDDPQKLSDTLRDRAGVVETGLFVNIATLALIADDNGVQERRRK